MLHLHEELPSFVVTVRSLNLRHLLQDQPVLASLQSHARPSLQSVGRSGALSKTLSLVDLAELRPELAVDEVVLRKRDLLEQPTLLVRHATHRLVVDLSRYEVPELSYSLNEHKTARSLDSGRFGELVPLRKGLTHIGEHGDFVADLGREG